MDKRKPGSSGLVGLGIQTTNNSPLVQFYSRMPAIVKKAGYSEMWGLSFAQTHENTRNTPRTIILQKFLAANDNDVSKAEEQFIKALKWRRANNPLGKRRKVFDRDTFEGMGYVTCHRISAAGSRIAVVWNLYGSIKNLKKTFENVQEGDDYMIAVMELAIEILDLPSTPAPMSASGPDPYNIVQVHDCEGANPWTTCPRIKSGLEKAMQLYQDYYPGLLKYHQFVNVGTMHDLGMKFFNLVIPGVCHDKIGSDIGKFQSCNSRKEAAREFFAAPHDFANFSDSLPVEYHGKGPSIRKAATLRFTPSKDQVAASQTESDTDPKGKGILKREIQAPAEAAEGPNTLDALIVSTAVEGSRQGSGQPSPLPAIQEENKGDATKDDSSQ